MGDQLGLGAAAASKSLNQPRQTVNGGSAGARRDPARVLLLPALNGLFICLSRQQGRALFMKILLFNGLFSAGEQEAAEEAVLH